MSAIDTNMPAYKMTADLFKKAKKNDLAHPSCRIVTDKQVENALRKYDLYTSDIKYGRLTHGCRYWLSHDSRIDSLGIWQVWDSQYSEE